MMINTAKNKMAVNQTQQNSVVCHVTYDFHSSSMILLVPSLSQHRIVTQPRPTWQQQTSLYCSDRSCVCPYRGADKHFIRAGLVMLMIYRVGQI